jgi:hypothetical protein
MTQRRSGNPNWVKGSTSPNPGGRPRVVANIQALARQHAPAAVHALVEALQDPKTKVPAAIALLDRGYGRPTTYIAGDGDAPPVAITFEWAPATPEASTATLVTTAVLKDDASIFAWDSSC